MKIYTLFPSRYLKASDLTDGDLTVTIESISMAKLQGDEEKPCLYFRETPKGLILNKTNSNTITELYGDETDDWHGERIRLYSTEVDFCGRQTMALRVRMKKPAESQEETPF